MADIQAFINLVNVAEQILFAHISRKMAASELNMNGESIIEVKIEVDSTYYLIEGRLIWWDDEFDPFGNPAGVVSRVQIDGVTIIDSEGDTTVLADTALDEVLAAHRHVFEEAIENEVQARAEAAEAAEEARWER